MARARSLSGPLRWATRDTALGQVADFPSDEQDFSSAAGAPAKLLVMPDNTSNTASLDELENALDYVAKMIDQRPEGEAYLCIFERLEEEIAALKARQCVRDRARARARERRAAA